MRTLAHPTTLCTAPRSTGCWLKQAIDTDAAKDTVEFDTYIRKTGGIAAPGYTFFRNLALPHGQLEVYEGVPFSQCPELCAQAEGCRGFTLNRAVGSGCTLLEHNGLTSYIEKTDLVSIDDTYIFPPIPLFLRVLLVE